MFYPFLIVGTTPVKTDVKPDHRPTDMNYYAQIEYLRVFGISVTVC